MKGTTSVTMLVLCSCILAGCSRGLTSDEAKRVIEQNKILAYHSVSVEAISASSQTEAIVRATIGGASTVNLKLRKFDKGWIWESVETKGGSWMDPGLALTPLIESLPKEWFGVGSSRGDVLKVQGRPNRDGPRVLVYGDAQVIFGDDDRVVRWIDPKGTLHARK